MRAILKREMKSYFSGPIGYVCIAVLLALSGLLYWQIMYTGSSSYIYMVYSNMFTYCMMVIPIITMKSLSDEQRNKTDQALLTAPVSVTAIVLGKFLAAFIVYAIAMTGTLLPCVAISLFGQPSWGEVFGYYLGSLFYGAAMISIGVFISSLTVSQIIAAIGTFIISRRRTPWARPGPRLTSLSCSRMCGPAPGSRSSRTSSRARACTPRAGRILNPHA